MEFRFGLLRILGKQAGERIVISGLTEAKEHVELIKLLFGRIFSNFVFILLCI